MPPMDTILKLSLLSVLLLSAAGHSAHASACADGVPEGSLGVQIEFLIACEPALGPSFHALQARQEGNGAPESTGLAGAAAGARAADLGFFDVGSSGQTPTLGAIGDGPAASATWDGAAGRGSAATGGAGVGGGAGGAGGGGRGGSHTGGDLGSHAKGSHGNNGLGNGGGDGSPNGKDDNWR